MTTYDEEQKLKELEREYNELKNAKSQLEQSLNIEEKMPNDDNRINSKNINIKKVSQDNNSKRIIAEFDEVKKDIDDIIKRFKDTKLAKTLGVYSEMEGIEFSWNN